MVLLGVSAVSVDFGAIIEHLFFSGAAPVICWCSDGLWCRCNIIGAVWCWCYLYATAVELPSTGSMSVLYRCSLVLVQLKVLLQWCFSGAGAGPGHCHDHRIPGVPLGRQNHFHCTKCKPTHF